MHMFFLHEAEDEICIPGVIDIPRLVQPGTPLRHESKSTSEHMLSVQLHRNTVGIQDKLENLAQNQTVITMKPESIKAAVPQTPATRGQQVLYYTPIKRMAGMQPTTMIVTTSTPGPSDGNANNGDSDSGQRKKNKCKACKSRKGKDPPSAFEVLTRVIQEHNLLISEHNARLTEIAGLHAEIWKSQKDLGDERNKCCELRDKLPEADDYNTLLEDYNKAQYMVRRSVAQLNRASWDHTACLDAVYGVARCLGVSNHLPKRARLLMLMGDVRGVAAPSKDCWSTAACRPYFISEWVEGRAPPTFNCYTSKDVHSTVKLVKEPASLHLCTVAWHFADPVKDEALYIACLSLINKPDEYQAWLQRNPTNRSIDKSALRSLFCGHHYLAADPESMYWDCMTGNVEPEVLNTAYEAMPCAYKVHVVNNNNVNARLPHWDTTWQYLQLCVAGSIKDDCMSRYQDKDWSVPHRSSAVAAPLTLSRAEELGRPGLSFALGPNRTPGGHNKQWGGRPGGHTYQPYDPTCRLQQSASSVLLPVIFRSNIPSRVNLPDYAIEE
ncbi:unnamed protein product [Peniophora sp. CBMAI 1063]|nr:unnamed protein product [Peniophora sp. CBMAI 1063]